ncbi:MAG: hypothetical protein ACPGRC_00835 [Salibacteraceae bacterium]
MGVEEQKFEEVGASIPESTRSQMFGKPCFKIGKKAFVCFFQNEMVFKLNGKAHMEALSLDGAKLFDPSGKGRPMKKWIQIPFHYQDQWLELSKTAFEYVKVNE